MLRWILRLFGRRSSQPSVTKEEEHLGPGWEARQRARRAAEASGNHGRLELDLGLSLRREDPNHRLRRQERRGSTDRRQNTTDRRQQHIPVKKNRRKNPWDRRRQYGERRFSDRRERSAAGTPQPPELASPPSLPRAAAPEPPPLPQAPEPYRETVSPDGYTLAIFGMEDRETVLHLDTAGGMAELAIGDHRHLLSFSSALAAERQLTLLVQGSFTLALDAMSAGAILLKSEKPQVSLATAMRRKPATVTLTLSGIGADIAMTGAQTFRFGKVGISFGLAQNVELQTASGPVRLSGPAGGMNFARYLETLERGGPTA